jgi:electron transport complex protein RnfE
MMNAGAPGGLAGRGSGVFALAAAIVPSLAVAVSVSIALWLSLAVIAALVATSLLAALLAGWTGSPVRPFVVLLVVTGLATAADRAAAAWLPAVGTAVGVYLPLVVVVMSGPVAASVLDDGRQGGRARRAAARALTAGLAFLGGTVLTAAAREALGAATVTLPGSGGGWALRLPALADAPARGLLSPFAALIAAGYLAGLLALVVRRATRGADRPGGTPAAAASPPAAPAADAGEEAAP